MKNKPINLQKKLLYNTIELYICFGIVELVIKHTRTITKTNNNDKTKQNKNRRLNTKNTELKVLDNSEQQQQNKLFSSPLFSPRIDLFYSNILNNNNNKTRRREFHFHFAYSMIN